MRKKTRVIITIVLSIIELVFIYSLRLRIYSLTDIFVI